MAQRKRPSVGAAGLVVDANYQFQLCAGSLKGLVKIGHGGRQVRVRSGPSSREAAGLTNGSTKPSQQELSSAMDEAEVLSTDLGS